MAASDTPAPKGARTALTTSGAGADSGVGAGVSDAISMTHVVFAGMGGGEAPFSVDGDAAQPDSVGDDAPFGDGGEDAFTEAGGDVINGSLGNDVIFASGGDGSNAFEGDGGIDTVDFEAIDPELMSDLGASGAGFAGNCESGGDVPVWIGGGGDSDIFAFIPASAGTSDQPEGFQAGDRVALGSVFGPGGTQATLPPGNFTAAGQIKLTTVEGNNPAEGNAGGDTDADIAMTVANPITTRGDLD